MLVPEHDKNCTFAGHVETEIDETAYRKILNNPLNMGID